VKIKSVLLFILTVFLVVASIGTVTYKSWYPYFKTYNQTAEKTQLPREIDFNSIDFIQKYEKIGSVSQEMVFDKGPVILNFWASWCAPCVQETPDLIEMTKKNPDLKILFISADSNKNEILSFLNSFQEMNSLQTRVLWDEKKELMNLYQVQLLPESFIYDKDLKYHRHIKGAVDWKNLDLNSK
jgi:thiol-disulfide isomerase/thioredoxin